MVLKAIETIAVLFIGFFVLWIIALEFAYMLFMRKIEKEENGKN